MYGQNSGVNNEVDTFKAYYATLGYDLKNIKSEFYYDLKKSDAGVNDVTTIKFFGGWEGGPFKVGGVYANIRQADPTTPHEMSIISAHGVYKLNKKHSVLARLDSVTYKDDNSVSIAHQTKYIEFSPDAKSYTVFIIGMDCSMNKAYHLIPNIAMVNYGTVKTGAAKPKNETAVKLTMAYNF